MSDWSSPALDRDGAGAEFDRAMARAGITVPPERRPALIAGYEDLKRRMMLLRQPREAAAEPAAIYRVRPRGEP